MNTKIIATILSLALAAWAQGAVSVARGVPPICCGDLVVTQNNDTTVISQIPAFGGAGHTSENAYARCFSSAELPANFFLQCVEFGVYQNTSPTGADFDVELRIVRLLPTAAFPALSCPFPNPGPPFGDPALGDPWLTIPPEFGVLHFQTVRIPDQFSGLMKVVLTTPVPIPAGADILVEIHAKSRVPSAGGDNGAFFPGGNEANPAGSPPTLWWEPFGLTQYEDLAAIDPTFTADWVVLLDGTSSPIPPPATDCNANGVPDECEVDCNANGIPDDCDVDPLDPDGNGLVSTDCNFNGIPDVCDVDPTDPDGNGQVSADCQADVIPDECQTDTFTYQLDDGTSEFFSGLPNGGAIAWMNHFSVRAGSETIGSVRVAWGQVADGTPAIVYLWSDPNGDGSPVDAQVLASAATTVQDSGTDLFTSVAIPPTVVGPAGTGFFVGAILTYQAGEKPSSLDSTTPSGQTWLVADAAGPIDPNNLAASAIPPFVAINGVALVRAVAPGDDCNNNVVPDICEGSNDVATFVGEAIATVPNPLLTCLFDSNGDGAVNGLDIQAFVDRLLAGP